MKWNEMNWVKMENNEKIITVAWTSSRKTSGVWSSIKIKLFPMISEGWFPFSTQTRLLVPEVAIEGFACANKKNGSLVQLTGAGLDS